MPVAAVFNKGDVMGRQADAFFYQDVDGDFVEFFGTRDAYYSEYVDERLTVYRRKLSGVIIGAKVSQVSGLLSNAPGIRLEVRDGRVSLDVLFKASCWTSEMKITDAALEIYEQVGDIARKIDRKADLG